MSIAWIEKHHALLLLAVLCMPSCVQTAREAVRQASPAAVEGAVEEAEDPTTRARLAEVLGDEKIRASSRELAASLAAGAVEGLTQEEQAAQLQRLTSRLAEQVTASVANAFLDQMTGEEFERRLERATQAAIAGAMRGVDEAARERGAALTRFVGVAAREAGRNAALGVDEAVRKRQHEAEVERLPHESKSVLLGAGEAAEAAVHEIPLLLIIAFGACVVGLAVLVWIIVRLRRRVHLLSQSVSRRDPDPA